MPKVTGRVIAGRYNLVETIGRGAMGVVWRARDSLLDRDVAIKEVFLSGAVAPEDRDNAYKRTMREARTAARLSHRGVVTIYDVVEEDGRPWIIMELVPARSLDQMLGSDGPLPARRACRVGQQLLAALAAAHSARVLHRDVKPSNVLIAADPDGDRAVLTDFGIAQFAGDPRLTQTGMVMGSPGFTAPERIRGGSASPASDLWSLGATLFAAVQGRGPYEQRGGAITTMSAIINEDAPLASSAGPLAPLIGALLRRDPATRPTAAAAARMFAGVLPLLPQTPPPARRTPTLLSSVVPAPSRASATSQDALAVTPAAPTETPAADTAEDAAPDEPPAAGTAEDAAPDDAAALDDTSAADTAGDTAPDDADDRGDADTTAPGDADTAADGQAAGGPAEEDADAAGGPSAAGGQPAVGGQFDDDGPGEDEPAEDETPPSAGGADDAETPRADETPPADLTPGTAEPEAGGDPAESRQPARAESLVPAPSQPYAPPPAASAQKVGAGEAVWPVMAGAGVPGDRGDPPTKPQPYFGPAPAPLPRPRRRRRGPRVAAAVVAVVLAAAIGVAVALLTRHHPQAADDTGKAGDTAAASHANLPDPVKAIDNPSAVLPPGWTTESVPPAEHGTAGGFSVGVPPGWAVEHKKLAMYLNAPDGVRYLDVDLTQHDRDSMLAEAQYVERHAVAEQHLPGYHRVSLRRVDIRGASGAFWEFDWVTPGGVTMRVDDLLFELQTPAGTQSYAVYFTSPDTGFQTSQGLPLFDRILRTFQPSS